ncbi:MFS transporter [Halopseudomonas pachastrellae]|nr:MFS transporter [Halopseudomonas pachastrellae]
MAANLSDPLRSGRAVGLVMSGLLAGILLARTAAGLLSEIGGWETVYQVSAVLMVLLAGALLRCCRRRATRRRRAMEQLCARYSGRRIAPTAAQPRLAGGLVFGSVSALFSRHGAAAVGTTLWLA